LQSLANAMAVTFEVVVKVLVNLFVLAVLASLFIGCGKEEKTSEASASKPASAKPVEAKYAAAAESPEESTVLGDCQMCGTSPYLVVWCGLDGKNEYHEKSSQTEAEEVFYGYVKAGRCRSAGYSRHSSDCHCGR